MLFYEVAYMEIDGGIDTIGYYSDLALALPAYAEEFFSYYDYPELTVLNDCFTCELKLHLRIVVRGMDDAKDNTDEQSAVNEAVRVNIWEPFRISPEYCESLPDLTMERIKAWLKSKPGT